MAPKKSKVQIAPPTKSIYCTRFKIAVLTKKSGIVNSSIVNNLLINYLNLIKQSVQKQILGALLLLTVLKNSKTSQENISEGGVIKQWDSKLWRLKDQINNQDLYENPLV